MRSEAIISTNSLKSVQSISGSEKGRMKHLRLSYFLKINLRILNVINLGMIKQWQDISLITFVENFQSLVWIS